MNPGEDVRSLETLHKGEARMVAESPWVLLLTEPTERYKMVSSCGGMFMQTINGILFVYSYVAVFATIDRYQAGSDDRRLHD